MDAGYSAPLARLQTREIAVSIRRHAGCCVWSLNSLAKGICNMATYDANTAQCVVYSYKDGLLSKIAHDLKHRVTRFAVHIDETTRAIDAAIDAGSLRVECVMKDGVESTEEMRADDKHKIEQQIAQEVLHADEHPVIRFHSTSVRPRPEGLEIEGMLALNAWTHQVSTLARRVNGHYEAELTIHQPAFGIKPFSAMMGTLKIKPDVLVRLVVPAK